VNWSEVGHLESKQLFMVKTEDGLVFSGILSIPSSPGERPAKLEVIETAGEKVALERVEVIGINETSKAFWERFNGEVSIGSTYSKANQAAQYNVASNVTYPQERWSAGLAFTSNLSSNTNTNTSTRNEITLTGQRLLRWNNWYYAGLADFLQSSEQGIDLQSTFGGGIGRLLKNTNHAKITLTGGIAWQQINYRPGAVEVPSEQVTSALIATNISLFYFDRTNLDVSANVLPALTDPGRVHVTFNTTYYVKLWKKLNWNITFYGNWDNRPPPGFSGSDYGTTSGLSLTFGNR
jgi:hypothetical protein